MKNNTVKNNNKPSPFIAPGAKAMASREEIVKKLNRIEKAKEIGQDITKVDIEDNEIENPYRVEALMYIINDQDVPQELKEKIKQFDLDISKLKE